MNAVIVDDEKQSHNLLKILIEKNYPEICITGNALNVNEGIKVILEDALTPSQQTGETTICRGPRNYDGSYTKYECPVR